MLGPDHSGCGREPYSCVLHERREGCEIRLSLCPSLETALLAWFYLRHVVLKARHILGYLNMIADKMSRHKQVNQKEWSLPQEIFNHLCLRCHILQVDLFATRFNNKLPVFVSPVLAYHGRIWTRMPPPLC